jgi:hypothetical protein
MKFTIEVDTTISKKGNAITRMRYCSQHNMITKKVFEAKNILPELDKIFNTIHADVDKNQEWCDTVYKERQPFKEEVQPEIIKTCSNCRYQTKPCSFFIKKICSNPINFSGSRPELNAGSMWELKV